MNNSKLQKFQISPLFFDLFIVFILVWMTVEGLFGIRFINPDDMFFSTKNIGDYFKIAAHSATKAGRFSLYYSMIYFLLPNAFWNNLLVYNAFLFVPLLVIMEGIVLLSHYLKARAFGILFCVFYLAFAQFTFAFNPLVSYPLLFTSAIILIITAIGLAEAFIRTKKPIYLVFSSCLAFLSYAHHDSFILAAAFTIIIFSAARQRQGGLKERLFHPLTLSHIGTFIVYATIFLIYYIAHPTKYAGNTFRFSDTFLSGFADTFSYYVLASLPLFHLLKGTAMVFISGGTGLYGSFSHPESFRSLFVNIQAQHIVKACVIVVADVLALKTLSARISRFTLLIASSIGVVLLLLPAATISLSSLYQSYVRGGYAPLHVTFFSSFGVAIILCVMISPIAVLHGWFRKVAIVIFCTLIGMGSIATSAFNAQIARSMQKSSNSWTAACLLGEHLKKVTKQMAPQVIFAPQLWNFYGAGAVKPDYWDILMRKTWGIDANIIYTPPDKKNKLERVSSMRFDCDTNQNCVVFLKNEGDQTTIALTSTNRTLAMAYTVKGERKTKTLTMVKRASGSLFKAPLYRAEIPDRSVDLETIRLLDF